MPHLPLPGSGLKITWRNIAKDIISPFKPQLPFMAREAVLNMEKRRRVYRTCSFGASMVKAKTISENITRCNWKTKFGGVYNNEPILREYYKKRNRLFLRVY